MTRLNFLESFRQPLKPFAERVALVLDSLVLNIIIEASPGFNTDASEEFVYHIERTILRNTIKPIDSNVSITTIIAFS